MSNVSVLVVGLHFLKIFLEVKSFLFYVKCHFFVFVDEFSLLTYLMRYAK